MNTKRWNDNYSDSLKLWNALGWSLLIAVFFAQVCATSIVTVILLQHDEVEFMKFALVEFGMFAGGGGIMYMSIKSFQYHKNWILRLHSEAIDELLRQAREANTRD